MPKYVALLRGINVGGKNRIKMADLVVSLEKLKFKDVITYIQSGNIIFESSKTTEIALGTKVSDAIKKDFGYDVPVIVLSATEFKKVAVKHPFSSETDDEKKLFITVLGAKPKSGLAKALKQKAEAWPDDYKIVGRTAFGICRNGYAKTKLTNDAFEKTLKVSATSRNWRTTRKIADLLGQ